MFMMYECKIISDANYYGFALTLPNKIHECTLALARGKAGILQHELYSYSVLILIHKES